MEVPGTAPAVPAITHYLKTPDQPIAQTNDNSKISTVFGNLKVQLRGCGRFFGLYATKLNLFL